jgi:hypothetical protein
MTGGTLIVIIEADIQMNARMNFRISSVIVRKLISFFPKNTLFTLFSVVFQRLR